MKNELVKSTLPNISANINVNITHTPNKIIHFPTHYHNELEFLLVHSGVFSCIINNHTYLAHAGDIIFINAEILHETTSLENKANCHSMLQFAPDNYTNNEISTSSIISRFINIEKEPIIVFKKSEPKTMELTQYLNNIFREYSTKSHSYELYIKANILSIIAFLSRENILNEPSTFFNDKNISKILPALDYIDKHYKEQISLKELSSVLNFNPSYFCRLFKSATNSTFIEYLNFVRICKSERMLSSSEKGIADISLELGFASTSYFNKIFKRYKGCTPTEYKKSKYVTN